LSPLDIHKGMLMVTSRCQLECESCVTQSVRKRFPDYDLSIQQLRNFVRATSGSKYHYQKIWLNGFGDPSLWRNLLPGLKMLHRSGITDEVCLASNMLAAKRLTGEVNQYCTIVPGGIDNKRFMLMPDGASGGVPCKCRCSGPTLIGNYILPYCGPVAYDNGVPLNRISTSTGYMKGIPLSGQEERSLPGCRTCWGNMNIKLTEVEG